MSDRHLDEIARSSCQQWKSLSIRLGGLGFVRDDLDALQVSEEEKSGCFFFKWKAMKGSRATYRSLVEGLLEISCQEDAENVCRLLKDEPELNIHTQQPISDNIPLLPHERFFADTGNCCCFGEIIIYIAIGLGLYAVITCS